MEKERTALLLALLCLTGCGKKGEPASKIEEPEPIPVEEPAPEPEPIPEPAGPAGINPLTGLPMEPEYEQNRPVAVMLNNLKKAQPQLGVSMADIIYEVPAEGGITRMLGVYQTLDGVGNLGSIRSARPYYIELAMGHDALYVHAGGSRRRIRISRAGRLITSTALMAQPARVLCSGGIRSGRRTRATSTACWLPAKRSRASGTTANTQRHIRTITAIRRRSRMIR